jgi:hypothetical protein
MSGGLEGVVGGGVLGGCCGSREIGVGTEGVGENERLKGRGGTVEEWEHRTSTSAIHPQHHHPSTHNFASPAAVAAFHRITRC